MGTKIKPDELQRTVQVVLFEYEHEFDVDTRVAVKKVCEQGVRELRRESARLFGNGPYAKGWTSMAETGRLSKQGVIYNKKVPGLPHLLERSHIMKNQYSRFGWSVARVHIAIVEDDVRREFQKILAEEMAYGKGHT